MLNTLDTFQKRYFAQVEHVIDLATGIKRLSYSILSDEELQRQIAIKNAKSAEKTRKILRTECEELLETAKSKIHFGFSLTKAQREVK